MPNEPERKVPPCPICKAPRVWGQIHLTAHSSCLDYTKAQLAALTAERDELQATYDLMSAAGHRAVIAWRKAHPDADMWPDQAANMVWLMGQVETLTAALTDVARSRIERGHRYSLETLKLLDELEAKLRDVSEHRTIA